VRRLTPVLAAALLAATVLLALPAASRATTLEKLTVAQLSRRAVAVVAGTVVSTKVQDPTSGVRTAVRLKVEKTYKGVGPRFMTVEVPGGVLPDGTRVVVAGMPAFRVGESSVVFVDVYGSVIGGFQGELDVSGARVAATGETLGAFGRRVQEALGGEAAAAPEARGPAKGDAPAATGSAPGRGAAGVTLVGISPSSASAGTDSVVTLSGSGFGSAQGHVYFSYGRNGVSQIAAKSIESWTGTSIRCAVPTGVIDDYAASAGTGPVVVVTAGGVQSNSVAFSVPFGYGGSAWTQSRATYRVNTSGVDDDLRASLVDAGAATWNAAGSGFTFIDGGATTAGLARDGVSVISWADGLPSGVLAMSYSDQKGGVISEADVQFGNGYSWGDGAPGSATYDIQSVITHELGHWLVLLDLYMPGDQAKVMYGFAAKEVQKRTLTADDVAGVEWVYPGAGPSPTPTPTPTLTPTPTASPTPTPTPTVVDVGPVCRARSATVKRGSIARIQYMVSDDVDRVVARALEITTPAGVVTKRWTGVTRTSLLWQSFRFRCDLRKGSYRIVVDAQDLTGNPASVVGRATLTVR
jgi:hypothetical protein